MYKIHLPFLEAWSVIPGNVNQLFLSDLRKGATHQHLALGLFHSEVLYKASTKSLSVENQQKLDVFWSTMVKVLVRHVTTKSRKVSFLPAAM